MSRNPRIGASLAVGLFTLAFVVSACIPQPGSSTTTTTLATEPLPPVISSFVVRAAGPAPAVVTLSWTISDPNGDTLTCRIDGDGDGTAEVVVADCPDAGSRNVSVANAGPVTASLTVEDATSAPVTSTVPFTVAAGVAEPFDVTLRGLAALEPDVAAAFTDAVDRWEHIIVRGIADFPVAPTPACLPDGSEPLPAVIDDVIIDVSVITIDDAGGILGQAGPTCVNPTNELTVSGLMQFDVDDVEQLIDDDALDAVILHEMAHVLGFGTLWDMKSSPGGVRRVIAGAGTSSVRFTGPRAIAEYSALGKSGNVPVENTGGAGTADSHWRESVFTTELMTGWLDSGTTPLSRMTAASMADLGLQVDLAAADAYSLPLPGAAARGPRPDVGVVLRPPVGRA